MIELSLEMARLFGQQQLGRLVTIKGQHVAQNWQIVDLIAASGREAAAEAQLSQVEFGIAEAAAEIAPLLTPVITGSLASSHAPFQVDGETFVAISRQTVNPWSDEDPWQYGPKVHGMGGISRSGHRRDFYENIIDSYGDLLLAEGGEDWLIDIGVMG